MANFFDNIITQGVRAGQIPARTSEARESVGCPQTEDRNVFRGNEAAFRYRAGIAG